jgi:hypothetical protein
LSAPRLEGSRPLCLRCGRPSTAGYPQIHHK